MTPTAAHALEHELDARQNGAAGTVSGTPTAARGSTPRSPGDVRRVCFARYLRVTHFVLAKVRPEYEAAGIPCTDATVAAIAATLFLGLCRTGGVSAPSTRERGR